MKRIISIILFCAMLLPSIACASDTSNKPADTTTPNTTPNTTAAPDTEVITKYVEPMNEALKELDYGGETIHILARSEKKYVDKELWVEELTNDPVSDAVYNRNLAVSELLGVEIVETKENGQSDLQQKVEIMVNSGDSTYDIVAASVAYGTPMINEGMMYNLYDNGIDKYLDATKPWWAQFWIEQAEMGDRLYCITGAAALSLTRLMFVIYYNKDLAENHGIGNLYEVVNEGKWTIDYLAELSTGIYRDLNGNDTRDMEDEYGIAIDNYVNTDIFWSSFDMKFLQKKSDGWFELATNYKEKISTAFDKVYSLIYENTGSYWLGGYVSEKNEDFENLFPNGTILFSPLELRLAESEEFRNMQTEYGILPTPKFDEAQDTYYTYPHDQYTVFMLPITVRDPEMSGAVLEAMAYESYKNLQPVYYDVVLKGRYANDPESRAMLDMITTNVTVDAAWIYGRQLGLPAASVFRSLIGDESKSFASAYAKHERTLNIVLKAMQKEIEAFDY